MFISFPSFWLFPHKNHSQFDAMTCDEINGFLVPVNKMLTLLEPRVLAPTLSTKEGGGEGQNGPAQYLKNDKRYKPETLRGVRGIL